jgi:hypothetical protein
MITTALTSALGTALRRSASALSLSALLAAPAHAAFVQGDWDPPYGAPFSNLGWEGSALIHVPNECVVGNGLVHNDEEFCPSGISVVNAEVRFYNLADSEEIVETLDFTSIAYVTDVFFEDGVATAFSLFSLGRVGSVSPEARPDGSPYNAYFSLAISYPFIPGDEMMALSSASVGEVTADLLWYENQYTEDLGGVNGPVARVTVRQLPTPVPVPGTLALALGSLALLGALRRR